MCSAAKLRLGLRSLSPIVASVTDVPELIVLGVIGEYVGRTYVETKGRPLYIVNREAGLADRLSSPERIVSSPPRNLTEADPPARND